MEIKIGRGVLKKLVLPILFSFFFTISMILLLRMEPLTPVTLTRAMFSSSNSGGHSETQDKVSPGFSEEEYQEIERIHKERVSLLRRYCENAPKLNRSSYTKRMLKVIRSTELLEKYKLMYSVVYKAGNSAVNSLIALLSNHQEFVQRKKTYKMQAILRPSFKEFEMALQSEDYVRFLVVREPLTRLLSAYRDRILTASHILTGQARNFVPQILTFTRGQEYSREEIFYVNGSVKMMPTFKEFVKYISVDDPTHFEAHWQPINRQFHVCYNNYTNIVHLETFMQDMQLIMRKTGINQGFGVSVLIEHAHMTPGGKTDDNELMSYYSTLDSHLFQKIIDVYKEDFIYFGYDPMELFTRIHKKSTI